MPVLQPLTGEITDQINLLDVGGAHNELMIQRIKRSIEKIKSVDINQYYMLNGMLFSVLGDAEASIENHEKSMRHSSDVIFMQNYAYSLKRIGMSLKAFELIEKVFEMQPTKDNFSEYTAAVIFSGVFSSFEENVLKFLKANPETSLENIHDVRYINHIREELKRAEVPEEQYHQIIDIADNIISQKRYMMEAIYIDGGAFDGVPYVSVEVSVKARRAEDLADINDAIADRMASSDFDAWDRVIVSVIPNSDEEAA